MKSLLSRSSVSGRGVVASTTSLALIGLGVLALGGGALAACSSTDSTPGPNADAGSDANAHSDAPTSIPLVTSNPCADALDMSGDPGPLTKDAASRGKVLKCAKEATYDIAKVDSVLKALGDKGKPAQSGFTVYKVLFQTERGDKAGSVGYSSGRIFVPDHPKPGKLPAVVVASGTRGQAGKCASSAQSPSDTALEGSFAQVYPIAAAGLPVIFPDLAGYANYGAANNPPSGYALADDVARSVLDASRAFHTLFPGLADTTVLVGHSQGGHSALSGLALGESYGAPDVKISAVAVFAPLWLSQRTWGALMNDTVAAQNNVKSTDFASAVTVWYHYSHAEVLDGPGEGVKLFKPEFQATVKAFFDNECLADGSESLGALGTYIAEGYDPSFVNAVRTASVLPLNGPPDESTLTGKWMKRYISDRPHLTGKAQQTPILVTYGGNDTTIPKERMACAVDRLKEDNAQYKFCYSPSATHGTIPNLTGSYVADWITHQTAGGADPGECEGDEGTAALPACATPPPND